MSGKKYLCLFVFSVVLVLMVNGLALLKEYYLLEKAKPYLCENESGIQTFTVCRDNLGHLTVLPSTWKIEGSKNMICRNITVICSKVREEFRR